MDKKEFVQRYVIENLHGRVTNEIIDNAMYAWDAIEKRFAVTPTTNLWDYNDMQR
jgi:hypothetical protein